MPIAALVFVFTLAHVRAAAQGRPGSCPLTEAQVDNHMVRRRDGSESTWFMAPDFLSFAGKDATTLCRQVKRTTNRSSHTRR